jgi:cation-transporting ATPase E
MTTVNQDNPSPAAAPAELRGLSAAEAADRAARGQVNRSPRSDWAEYRDIVRRNLFTLFNAMVAPAAVALFVLGEYPGAWAVSGMALVNTFLGLAQEVRAKRHLDQLAVLVEVRVRVLRDGEVCTLPTGDVVLGDHVLLAAGEPIVADGVVLRARFLEVDEALLTGESDPVPRQVGDRLLSGSICVAGEGVYRADRVGSESFANQTAIQARRYHYTASPMQRNINRLVGVLTYTTVALCLVYVGLYLVGRFPGVSTEERKANLAKAAAATVTSMVPQGLVLMATLALILGAVRMSRRGAVVQRLNAVESMAAVNVLCMDKTGTLTTGRLQLDQVRVLGGQAEAEAEVRSRLRVFAWQSIDSQSKSIQTLRAALGDPAAPEAAELLDQLPFKSQNRFSAVRVRMAGVERVLVLGACEALRPFLSDNSWEAAWQELLPTGLRLLLFAEGAAVPSTQYPARSTESAPGAAGPDGARASFPFHASSYTLHPLALVALSDELRPEAGAVLEALADQGIGFKVLSGDNPQTVRATVAHLKLPLAREPVVSGDELAGAADSSVVIRKHSVFGRVAPQQKLDIVSVLQAQGDHVAMIGDGVNDVLPIKRADLGIAMGEGSSASRTVAGLVLENNNFELLPQTLDEGRIILRNLRRAAKLFLLKNVFTLLLIVFGFGVCGLEFPYEPQQVTLLNFLTIGTPAFLITLGRKPVREPSRISFLREVGGFVLVSGAIVGLAGLAIYLLAAFVLGEDPTTQKTLLLSTLVLLGLGNLLRVLAVGEANPWANRWSIWWVVLAVPGYMAVMYLPPTAWFFELTPLTPLHWGLVLLTAGLALLLCRLTDGLARASQPPA